MPQSGTVNIETQTEDGEIISICHINEKSIALDHSPSARILFKRNRKLFDKINKKTKIVRGRVIRQSVTRAKSYVNRLMVKVGNLEQDTRLTLIRMLCQREIKSLFLIQIILQGPISTIPNLYQQYKNSYYFRIKELEPY